MQLKTGAKKRLFYGWWIVAAGFIVVIYGTGAHNYLTSQLFEFVEQLGSSASQAGTALSISGIVGSIALLAIGPLIDRFGPRKLMLVGIPLAGVGFIGLSFVNSLLMLNLLQGILLAIGINAGFLLPVQTVTANWFVKRRSLALAFICVASVLGEGLIDIFGERIADIFSWQGVFLGLGAVMLVLGIPLALVIRHRPEQHGYLPDGRLPVTGEMGELSEVRESRVSEINFTLWQALKTRAFWMLTIGMTLVTVAGSMATMFRMACLMDKGFDIEPTINILKLVPLMGLVGILLFGYLGDKFPKRYLLAIAVALQSISMVVLMTAGGIAQVYLYTFVYGLGSGTMPLVLAIRADYFGRKYFATITVVMMFASTLIGMLLGLGSTHLIIWIYDVTENFWAVFLLSMFIGLLTAVVFFFARPPRPPQPELTPIES